VLNQRRRMQTVAWMHGLIHEALLQEFYRGPEVKARLPALENAVAGGKIPPLAAARELLQLAREQPVEDAPEKTVPRRRPKPA